MVKGYLLSNYNSIAPIYERVSIMHFVYIILINTFRPELY